MVAKIDKTGEIGYNNFGSKMIIVKYRMSKDIDVYFPEYDWTIVNTNYNSFKKGNIKCPYERRTYGKGYLGEGDYKTKENGKINKCYQTWINILTRCYNKKYHEKRPTYKECTVCDEWLNFQNFAKWYYENYYEIEGENMTLDKDILCKGNKIYSPENCIFVPEKINVLFTKCDKVRGNYPVGVTFNKECKKYVATHSVYNLKSKKSKNKYLGLYNTPKQAFEVYKNFKERYIKEVADEYKDKISKKLYDAIYKYEVEITD